MFNAVKVESVPLNSSLFSGFVELPPRRTIEAARGEQFGEPPVEARRAECGMEDRHRREATAPCALISLTVYPMVAGPRRAPR